MTGSFEQTIRAVAWVKNARSTPEDDRWGGVTSVIELDETIEEDALLGLDAFSHVVVLFAFHRLEGDVHFGLRHPRGNEAWPRVGIFAQRARRRPNRLGVTCCRVERVEGRRLHVRDLDAIDGTPVIDIKPFMEEFAPRGVTEGKATRQPGWSRELMQSYWDDEL